MSKGLSIHIGLDTVDPAHYDGWDGKLEVCEADACDMQELANSCGFESLKLLSADATRDAVTGAIKDAMGKLGEGDMLMVSYSGHGGQIKDLNQDEADLLDETWCLYDGMLIDDELYALWRQFPAGVRILVLSDSCHSGTVVKAAKSSFPPSRDTEPKRGKSRLMPPPYARRTYNKNRKFYNDILKKKTERTEMKADLILLSGCQDNQQSYESPFNGYFTGSLLAVWNEGQFKGNYFKFHKMISNNIPEYQSPNLLYFGPDVRDFLDKKPFRI